MAKTGLTSSGKATLMPSKPTKTLGDLSKDEFKFVAGALDYMHGGGPQPRLSKSNAETTSTSAPVSTPSPYANLAPVESSRAPRATYSGPDYLSMIRAISAPSMTGVGAPSLFGGGTALAPTTDGSSAATASLIRSLAGGF